jgi:hypothetical protein
MRFVTRSTHPFDIGQTPTALMDLAIIQPICAPRAHTAA